jgi:hypothetical protein
VTGITADAAGRLYFSAMTEDGVDRPYEVFKIALP